VVGGSLAGLRAAEGLRRAGFEGRITVLGAERHPPYDRPPLSKQVLTGKSGPDSVRLDQAEGLDIEWVLGTSATGLDIAKRRVTVGPSTVERQGRHPKPDTLPYDFLVIATGAQPRLLRSFEPSTGAFYLRTLDDAVALRDTLGRAQQVVVIGAGFIGLEVASSASALGADVTVLEALPVPLSRAIGDEMGNAVADFHRRQGVAVRTGVAVEGVVGSGAIEGIRLAGGEVVPAQVVVVGVGVSPVTGWLATSGIDIDNGVECDERLRVTSGGRPIPGVVAAGDVARWIHPAYGPLRVEHWTNAVEQGEAAARSLMLGDEAPPFAPVPYFWSDQHGAKLQFVGDARASDDVVVVDGAIEDDRFVVAYGRNGKITAALGMRRPAKVMALQKLIEQGGEFPPPAPG
jgi:NADPH-dependent 2,4-dienoyl-CoA reductase/sulfur reductase-like enzyme